MRALPADSLEYFVEIDDGNTAWPAAAGAAAGVAGGGAAGAAPAAGAAAEAPAPHSALRKSFQVFPCSVPAVCAALYLALHSFIVSARASEAGTTSNAAPSIAAAKAVDRPSMTRSFEVETKLGATHQHRDRNKVPCRQKILSATRQT